MSADNAIFVQARSDGTYAFQHGQVSALNLPRPHQVDKKEIFPTILLGLRAFHAQAQETEYGFIGVWFEDHDLQRFLQAMAVMEEAFGPTKFQLYYRDSPETQINIVGFSNMKAGRDD